MNVSLTMTERQHTKLKNHLLDNDGKESVAILLCGSRDGELHHRLMVREVHIVPNEECLYRSETQVRWDTETIIPVLELAYSNKWTVVKIHSHPTGFTKFSQIDNESDEKLLPSLQSWTETEAFHASMIMLPDGTMFGRFIDEFQQLRPLTKVCVVGDDIHYWFDSNDYSIPSFASSHAQAFGDGTYSLLSRLSIAVVGCSGTGSIVVEMLARLGVGCLVLIDDDIVEERNINRIINSSMGDARNGELKIDVLANAIKKMGIGTDVRKLPYNLWNENVVKVVAQCDIIFGCMDTVDGRYLLNSIATYYSIPYFDLGVKIIANLESEKLGEIDEVCGGVHYLQPGQSLLQRKAISKLQLTAAELARTDPDTYTIQVEEGYIKGIPVHQPAVISVNMLIASLGVNELLARLHPYREENNSKYDHVQVTLASMEIIPTSYDDKCDILGTEIGKGDQLPLVGMLEFS